MNAAANISLPQPQVPIMMNNGFGDGSNYPVAKAWPSDLIAIERGLPNSLTGHVQWREIEGKRYYMPSEVCDPIGKEWFFIEEDRFGEPVVIGDVTIRTGDYLMADRDGAIIIPEQIIDEATTKVEEVLRTENKVRTAILQGVDPVDAYLRHRKF
jgi:hypothetical protein